MHLIWNAIVKNESAIIERCVNSLLPHVDGAVIVDTGSTDDTPNKLIELFAAAKKPIEIHSKPFVNFEQARNAALHAARMSPLAWDYLLLADADMELRVKQQPWLNGEKGLSYDLRQQHGSLGYYNRRLVSRHATGWYVGVTHEYLDIPTDGFIRGAEFYDHADGANRPDKLGRDIALLEEALKTETRPGLIERYHFYLAATYFDLKNWDKAAWHYGIRRKLGGYVEECWYAQMRYAVCLLYQGNPAGFVAEMLEANRMRPQRAEPLHWLARYYREQGDNTNGLMFANVGLALPHPATDRLFVDDWVYKYGLKEELAICGFYNEQQRDAAAKACNELALQGSQQARGNLYWYLKPLSNYVPSFKPQLIEFTPPEGYIATNPSIVNDDGKLTVLVRTVNYLITPEGRYEIRGASGHIDRDHPISTRNYLVFLDSALNPISSRELLLPPSWEPPKYNMVLGFEDSRLFYWKQQLWTVSTVRELNVPGLCQPVVAPLDFNGYTDDWRVFESHQGTHEKNWMPWVRNGELDFVYRLGSLIHMAGGEGFYRDPQIVVSNISGGSQVITADGINIALVHEAHFIPGRPYNRFYLHRFVTFANDGGLRTISAPFCFHDRQIEFAAGLAYLPDKRQLVASYGVRDSEPWLATMDLDEVITFLVEGKP